MAQDDESLWAWGLNYFGQPGDGTTNTAPRPSRVRQIRDVPRTAAGGYQSLAGLTQGRLLAWGAGDYGQPGDGANADSTTPTFVSLPTGPGVKLAAFATGQAHSLATLTNT